MNRVERALEVERRLAHRYSEASLALQFSSPLQLLVAVILSAQCTDARVNAVTPSLFARFPRVTDLARAPLDELEELVHSTGFYRNKAKTIRACCADLVARFAGDVPRSLHDLVSLPGVGRKTANMVLGNAYGIPGLAVDTHVKRVAGRLGLTEGDEAGDIERQLCDLLPENRWTAFSNGMILFGREVCTSRSPGCSTCPLVDVCVSA
ncbi:endonuclease III [Candidatus Fermentibacteria bacterium]|nr:endonuclease III [Candidatus Fermentibacteria bacterium]